MIKKLRVVLILLTAILFFTGIKNVQAKSDNVIQFKDKKLERALCDKYSCKAPITKKMAHELSTKDTSLYLSDTNISDLEGLQFFDGITQISLRNNNISNFKPLSKLPNLIRLDISDNKFTGKGLEDSLKSMGKIEELSVFECYNNQIEDISFLKNICNLDKLEELQLGSNEIKDISILYGCKDLQYLYLDNNRITDVTPLAHMSNKTLDLYLYNNCIIDYIPIKSLFDNMFDGRCGGELPLDRVDYYKNPVNILYQNKYITFPHLTVYYMKQAYVEAVPLIEALGGKAAYDKDSGILTCNYNNNELIMKDFSNKYTLNGTDKKITYEMRRMQYDTAYVAVADFCDILGINYHALKEREIYNGESEFPEDFPEVIEINAYEATGKSGDYKYKVNDNQIGILRYLGNAKNVIIPSQINGLPVTYIEEGAFCNDINLESVEIPNTVIRIGTPWGEKGVFTGCDYLVSVKLNEGKEDAYIGSCAFLSCSKLSSIKIPGNFRIIYDSAFNNCTSLQAVTISEGMERIEAGAFAGDVALTSVTIPSTIKELGYKYNEEDIVDSKAPNTTGVFAFCFDLKTVNILEGKGEAYIGNNAFYECFKLENITIPGNYYVICDKAFYNCKKLNSVIYQKGSLKNDAYQKINDNAFENCIRLEDLILPETLSTIGDNAFLDCSSLKELIIPEGVTKIGYQSFAGNTSLQSVTIPSTMISIGNSSKDSFKGATFYGCKNLTTVLLKEGNQNATIGGGTFTDCRKLKSIVIPGNYVTIGTEAFINCVGLKTVNYQKNSNPSTKQKILYNAFKECTSLVTVSLPSTLTYIDDSVFANCTALKKITIPTGVNQLFINSFIFEECTSLTSIYIGDYVKCDEYALSLTNSEAIIYTNNKSVKKLAEAEEFKVLAPTAKMLSIK